MKLKFEAGMNQSQKAAIAPELNQALKVLQYSSEELYRFIQHEMEMNPLLEISDESGRAVKRTMISR